METHVVAIKPPLQIVDVGNGCEAFSASIYIPAKSELTATLQSIFLRALCVATIIKTAYYFQYFCQFCQFYAGFYYL